MFTTTASARKRWNSIQVGASNARLMNPASTCASTWPPAGPPERRARAGDQWRPARDRQVKKPGGPRAPPGSGAHAQTHEDVSLLRQLCEGLRRGGRRRTRCCPRGDSAGESRRRAATGTGPPGKASRPTGPTTGAWCPPQLEPYVQRHAAQQNKGCWPGDRYIQ